MLLLHFEILLVLKSYNLLLFFKFLLLSVLLLYQCGAHLLGPVEVHCVVLHNPGDCFPAVVDLRQLDEHWDQIEQLSVFGVVVPRDDRNSALWLKHVCAWRVVQNDRVLHVSADLAHVFREHSIYVCAVLSKQTHRTVAINIHLIHQWVCVL